MKQRFNLVKIKYGAKYYEKNMVKNHKKMRKQLLEIFPKFQQFKVEIRRMEEWVLDWDSLCKSKFSK